MCLYVGISIYVQVLLRPAVWHPFALELQDMEWWETNTELLQEQHMLITASLFNL